MSPTPLPSEAPGRSLGAPGRGRGRFAAVRFATLVLLVTGLVVGAAVIGPDRTLLLRAGSDALGAPFAPGVAIVASAALVTVAVPRTLVALVGGALFGWLPGAGYTLVGVTLGASLAYGVGRLLGRSFVAQRLRGRLAAAESTVADRGMLAVAVARLIPLVPFGISNYAFGTTAVSPARFMAGTLLGAAPGMAVYAALGSATSHGNTAGTTVAGALALGLTICGSIGTYLVWRRRPRITAEAAGHPAKAGRPAVMGHLTVSGLSAVTGRLARTRRQAATRRRPRRTAE